ncbi:MAG: DUF2341 domain-containing protein, partial [Acidobacteriia bacterium]|nr:DUF2341 domain-containing protein [Terriglobia bacterium]
MAAPLWFPQYEPTPDQQAGLTATLSGGGTQQFTATVANTTNTAVTWTISPATGAGTIGSTGLYTAPATITAQQTVTIAATSQADSTKAATATVTLSGPISVTVAPGTSTLSGGGTQQFTATVANTTNTAVTWTISPATGAGMIGSTGLYTAPATITAQQTATITATSQADSTKSATATVTLSAPVSVAVAPGTATLYGGGTQQFTATAANTTNAAVTWSISPATGAGIIGSTGLYTAPATITAQQTVTITATSQADSTKAATATVTLSAPVNVAVVPGTATLYGGGTQQFVTTVANTTNAAVTWTISPATGAGTIGSNGLYAAPATITAQQAVTITATSQADSTTSATATLTLYPPITLTVGPDTATLYGGQTQQFAATLANANSTAVAWSIAPPGSGTIDSTGLYTAPATVTTQQTVTITAKSQADGSTSSTATVTLMSPVTVAVSPATATVVAGQTQQFTATLTNASDQSVTWTLTPAGYGTISATGLYTAPASIATSQNVTITAHSVADPTKFATAQVSLSACALSSYSHVRAIVINHRKVPSTDQTNFPILISGTYSYLATVANGGNILNPNGYDIAFTTDFAGTNKLDHELESYSPATGAINAWVRIPNLSHTTDTVIYLNYGNASVSSSQENKQAVWDRNYKAVVHFPSTVGAYSGGIGDSTENHNDLAVMAGTPAGAVGPYNGSATFNGSQYIYRNNPTGFSLGSAPRTVESWVQSPVSRSELAGYGSNNGNGHRFMQYWDGTCFVTEVENDGKCAAFALSDGNWHHIVSVLPNGRSTTADILSYVDGVLIPATGGSISLNTDQGMFAVGTIPGALGNSNLRGSISEVRISNVDRSADWIATEFNNQKSPASFYSIYPENEVGVIVAPGTATLYGSQSQQFTAATIGTCGGPVTWANSGGVGSITAAGLYTAPATVSTQQIVTITATSLLNSTKSALAAVTLWPPVSVSISPQTGTLSAAQTLQFTAGVQYTTNPAVTWSISPVVGTISDTGRYTAPGVILSPQTVTVTATSVADPSKSASATVALLISSFAPIRINSGGPTYTDPAGRVWAADSNYATDCPGNGFSFSFVPPAGVDGEYGTGRACTMTYQFAVPN